MENKEWGIEGRWYWYGLMAEVERCDESGQMVVTKVKVTYCREVLTKRISG